LHDPGLDACPFCGAVISTGGNAPRPDATRAPRRGPGQYYYRGPHYRFTGPTYLDGPHPNLDTPYDY